MRNFLLTISILFVLISYGQDYHFYTTTNTTHANRDISSYGKVALTEPSFNIDYLADLGIYRDDNISLRLENNHGRFDIGLANCNGCYNSTAQKGDVVFRILSKDNFADDFIYYLNGRNSGDVAFRIVSGYKDSTFNVYDNDKVTIGTRSFDNDDYNLYVLNGIKTEKVKVEIASENGWADYVFNSDYNLMPLSELQKFINENQHLPEVPTSIEVVENGIELKEMNVLLLKKVEELTLYIIDLEQRIKDLEEKANQ